MHFLSVGTSDAWGATAQLKRFQSLLASFKSQWSAHLLQHVTNTEAHFDCRHDVLRGLQLIEAGCSRPVPRQEVKKPQVNRRQMMKISTLLLLAVTQMAITADPANVLTVRS
jgi:hypothetical protein